MVCYIVAEHVALSPFYHELDKYTDGLVADHMEDPKSYLSKWYVYLIDGICPVSSTRVKGRGESML